MKKQYTRKQIQEAIAHWTKVLESNDDKIMHIQVKAVVDGQPWSEDTGEPKRYSATEPGKLLIHDAVFNMMTSLAEDGCYIDEITLYLVDGEDRTEEAEKMRQDNYAQGMVTVLSDDEEDYDDMYESKKTYTKRQITEAIAYWENRLKMMTENDHKWNPAIEKIVSSFLPRVHSIEGVSLAEFGSEDPVELAKKLYASLASKNGLTGTRYVPGGHSHAGFDYHNYLDGDFKLYFNDLPTFTFRHMVLKRRDTEWIPDGNPYDGVCPKTVWRTMANSCAIAVKPGFKMADLKNVEKGMKVVDSLSLKFEVSDADYPFYTLRWLFLAPYVQSWAGNAEKKYYNYLNFVSYEAGPFLTRKILSLGAIAGEDLVDMTQQIVKMAGVDRALEPGKGDAGQTAEQFKSMRDYHRAKVLQPALKRKKAAAAAQSKIAELKKLIGSGITYGELYDRKDFPSIVTAVLTSSKPYHWVVPTADDYHDALYTCSSDIELGRHQRFSEEAYNEAFFEEMDAAIESFIDDAEDLPVDYAGFEGKIVDAADEANNNVDTSDYVEDEEPEPDWDD